MEQGFGRRFLWRSKAEDSRRDPPRDVDYLTRELLRTDYRIKPFLGQIYYLIQRINHR